MSVTFHKFSTLASFQFFTQPVIHVAETLTQFAFHILDRTTASLGRLLPDLRPKSVGDVVLQTKKAKSALFETPEGNVLIEITQDDQGRYTFSATKNGLKPVIFVEGTEEMSGALWEVKVSGYLQQVVARSSSVSYGVCAKRWKSERWDLLSRLLVGYLCASAFALPRINEHMTLSHQGALLEGRVLKLSDTIFVQTQLFAVQATTAYLATSIMQQNPRMAMISSLLSLVSQAEGLKPVSNLGRRLLSQDCLSYVFPSGVTGRVRAVGRGGSAIIPTLDGNKTFIAMLSQGYLTSGPIMISVNANNGTELAVPMSVNAVNNIPMVFGGGARFGNGKIGICYSTGSAVYSGDYSIYLLVLNPDGSTDRTALLYDYYLQAPTALSSTRLLNGNIEVSFIAYAGGGEGIRSFEVDSSANVLSAFQMFSSGGIYLPCRTVSSGQYPTGQKLVVCHDKDGLRAYVFSGSTHLYTSNLIFNGETPDPTVAPVTVTTKSGPVTFWKTFGGDLHAGWVNRKNGVVTALSVDDGGLVESVKVATNYDPKNPNQPEYLAVMIVNGGSLVVRVLDAVTLAPAGCDTPLDTVTVGSGGMMSVAFFPDQQTLRTLWYQSGSNMNITDFKLNQPPIAAPAMPQNGTIGEFKCTSFSATDPNDQSLTWSFGFNGGALPAGFTTTQANGSATICWNLPQGFVRGAQILNISVNDGHYNGQTTFAVPFEVLNRNPAFVSGPTGTQTVYSNTPPQTVWSYIVTGTDLDGDLLSVYLDPETDPAVSANGKYLMMTVTPADVGRSVSINYAVKDNFGGISPPQTVTFVVADRFPVVNPFVFPDATAGVSYSYNLPGNTFTEPDGQATVQDFANLPEGLKYNPTTNMVEGIPLEASMTTMTSAKTFAVGVSNTQTANGLTTTQIIPLIVKPNPLTIQQTEHSRLSNVNAILGLTFGTITGLGLLLNGVIASRIIRYKAPEKWKEHQGKSLFIRITKIVGSSFAICFIPSARVKAQERYNLNSYGSKKQSVSLEMGSMNPSSDRNKPLLQNEGT